MAKRQRALSSNPLQPGDQVLERMGAGRDLFVRHDCPNRAQILTYATNQRQGILQAINTVVVSKGRRARYADVLWEGSSSPSRHALSMLIPAHPNAGQNS